MKGVDPKLFPYSKHEIDACGFRMAYVDEGSGDETILAVHGNPTWSFYYRRVIEQFSGQRRVVAVDHVGCGQSDKPSQSEFDYTLESHRDNVVALIDELDLENITLLAHDWGGAIGLASVLQRKQKFNRIILLNTGAFPPPYVPLRIAACRIPLFGTLGVRGFNLFAKAAITMAMSRNKLDRSVAAGLLAPYDNWKNRVAVDAFVRDIPRHPNHVTYSALQELSSRLPELASMPSLLVWGMKDWCFRPECLRIFQEHWPDAITREIADAGHYVIEDAPDETLAAIAEFLECGSKERTIDVAKSGG